MTGCALRRPAGTALRPLLLAPLAVAAGLGLGGCGGEAGDAHSGGSDDVAAWELSDEPALEIGVQEGEEPYQLHRVRDAALLPDGSVAVLNGGTAEVRVYDSTGAHLRTLGGEGDGPGEFRYPSRIRVRGDTIVVLDERLRALVALSPEGEPVDRTLLPSYLEDAFPAETWLTGRTWIEGAVSPGERARVRAVLAPLPEPDTTAPFRFALLGEDGTVWTTSAPPPWPDGTRWTVRTPGAGSAGALETPPDFLPTRVRRDRILGIATDSLGVQRVRLYPVRGSEEPVGADLEPAAAEPDPEPAAVEPDSEAAAAEPGSEAAPRTRGGGAEIGLLGTQLRGLVRMLSTLQERFYAGEMAAGRPGRYARSIEELTAEFPLEIPGGMRVELVSSGPRSWLSLAEVPAEGVRCIVNFGTPYMAGIPFGRAVCWQEGPVESREEESE